MFLPLIDEDGISIGDIAVDNKNGHCHVLTINVTDEVVNIQVAPQTNISFEVYDKYSPSDPDEHFEIIYRTYISLRWMSCIQTSGKYLTRSLEYCNGMLVRFRIIGKYLISSVMCFNRHSK